MKKLLVLSMMLLFVTAAMLGCNNGTPEAADRADDDIAWQYKTADEVKEMIETDAEAIYLDIRQPDNYNAGHLPGSTAVPAFPVDTPELEDVLRGATGQLAGDAPIIVVCEGGQKGAKRTISVLIEEGFAADRFYILEGGAGGWPHPELWITEDGAADEPAATAVAPVEQRKVYVTPEWLHDVIAGNQPQSADYVLLEVSWGDAGDAYKSAHIPGAIHLNTDLLEEETYWNLRTPEEIEQLMLDLGITKDIVVIAYGGSAAARAAFACLWAGVEEVHLLDGGFAAWEAAGYETESGVAEPTPVTAFGTTVPQHPEYLLRMPEEVIAMQEDENFRLVSIRSWEEFIGETSGYSYIDRAGEPLGAVWGYDEGDYHQADGTIKSLSEIQTTMWDEWDIKEGNTISFYCGTGWRACVPFFILYENGWENISLYDGGWFVWQMDESLPVQTGDPR